jgi:hypothetical protein
MMQALLSALLVLLPATGDPPHASGYRILVPGPYPWTPVKAHSGENWLALCETDSGCGLRWTGLLISLIDGTGNAGVPEWGVSPADSSITPLLFLDPADLALRAGEVPTALVRSPVMLPGDEIDLGGYGTLYSDPKGLWLSDRTTSQRLCSVYPDSRGEEVTVVWAGDLDGDGLVDLVLNDRSHYALVFRYRLFLSSEAYPGSLVREVASTDAVAC